MRLVTALVPWALACAVQAGARGPSRIDLTALQSAVKDQGARNTCVAHAVLAAMEAAAGGAVDLSEEHAVQLMDEAAKHTKGRRRPWQPGDGNNMSEAARALTATGVVREALWPYDPEAWEGYQAKTSLAGAPTVRIRELRAYSKDELTLAALEAELAAGHPVAFSVQQAWDEDRAERKGSIGLGKGKPYGKHALLAVGYDRGTRTVRVKNSFGPEWGERGYARMSFAYFEAYALDGLAVRAVASAAPRPGRPRPAER